MGLSHATRHRGVLWTAAASLPLLFLLTGCRGGDDGASPGAERKPAGAGSAVERCHTSGLSASVGPGDAGAGQRSFSVALTNQSGRTCTVRGFPGAAFTDADGGRLGPDPERVGKPPAASVVLAAGESAWAALSFPDPRLTGSRAAQPETLLITPPDERRPLSVRWENGEVPVSDGAELSVTAFTAESRG
ncbi:DUF4232 domain-containing protein [Streptomyces fragilis]|uniref:DUF4232 domain-containing protein n=1 Tax=Streptomyces fragilis TaxID=67301 RepID=A0ABV2YQA2_9ACTN|nr:DUF4232 domain-containing protein [Streptomyces fragilis]